MSLALSQIFLSIPEFWATSRAKLFSAEPSRNLYKKTSISSWNTYSKDWNLILHQRISNTFHSRQTKFSNHHHFQKRRFFQIIHQVVKVCRYKYMRTFFVLEKKIVYASRQQTQTVHFGRSLSEFVDYNQRRRCRASYRIRHL